MKKGFEIYYKGKPLNEKSINNMEPTDFGYYKRLLDVCIYGEEEMEEMKKLGQKVMIARFIKNHSKDFD
jgi:hypothetical protein